MVDFDVLLNVIRPLLPCVGNMNSWVMRDVPKLPFVLERKRLECQQNQTPWVIFNDKIVSRMVCWSKTCTDDLIDRGLEKEVGNRNMHWTAALVNIMEWNAHGPYQNSIIASGCQTIFVFTTLPEHLNCFPNKQETECQPSFSFQPQLKNILFQTEIEGSRLFNPLSFFWMTQGCLFLFSPRIALFCIWVVKLFSTLNLFVCQLWFWFDILRKHGNACNENGLCLKETRVWSARRHKQKGNCGWDLKQWLIFWNYLYCRLLRALSWITVTRNKPLSFWRPVWNVFWRIPSASLRVISGLRRSSFVAAGNFLQEDLSWMISVQLLTPPSHANLQRPPRPSS